MISYYSSLTISGIYQLKNWIQRFNTWDERNYWNDRYGCQIVWKLVEGICVVRGT